MRLVCHFRNTGYESVTKGIKAVAVAQEEVQEMGQDVDTWDDEEEGTHVPPL